MIEEDDSFDSLFAEEDEPVAESTQNEQVWKILLVDDEQDIHSAIRLALDNFSYEGRKIKFFDAYSGEEAKKILQENSDIALILLDVVMETSHAGLDFVKFIRNDLQNHFIRVVLWTGQPGYAPKKDVILSYEINDYKTKTDLTDDNIFTAVLASIRAYNAIMTVESYRLNLEQKVIERTKTIEEQKKKIVDSISYAEKIQRSILPSKDVISKYFPESFIVFKPRDVVSGDFYWLSQISEQVLFVAVADCTGHGVPGAFMSMIGNTLLNEIIASKEVQTPADILRQLNAGIIEALTKHTSSEDAQTDGMDITLCKFDFANNVIELATANHVLLVLTHNTLHVVEGNYESIGGIFSMRQTPDFKNISIPIESGMRIYMFSDGIQDQFGGSKNEKFSRSRIEKVLLDTSKLSMHEQGKALEQEFESWKSGKPQLDDVLLLGIQL
ncbi:MAG TPA: SpoIIE family protein phosphatase [Bacteroidales bacterium]|nr:MAG: DNA-binding transcriptional regulator CpxR [Bacteroidetes bacterium ADurb.Bin217]HPH16107.1 SpoIIE family protein phosphatase [Bacteroidales bacterium]